MDQTSLFESAPQGDTIQATRLALPGADVEFHPQFLNQDQSDELLADLDETVIWSQESVQMYGRRIPIPRLTAWYGDPGQTYSYSKINMSPLPWTGPLRQLRDQLEGVSGARFNSVLLNLYRRGSDGVAWHCDDEPELGTSPVIASVSLGATRKFQLRCKADSAMRQDISLTHGSLLLMRGTTQRNWEHQIPKTSRDTAPRINLTFRLIR